MKKKVISNKPRHISEKTLSIILSKMTSERNILRKSKINEYRPMVMKMFARDYLSALLNVAIDKSEVIDTTKKNLGSVHVLQFPSKNSAEWDKENGLTDCSLVLTHKYKYATVSFDDSFRQRALKNLKNGREYLKQNFRWLDSLI